MIITHIFNSWYQRPWLRLTVLKLRLLCDVVKIDLGPRSFLRFCGEETDKTVAMCCAGWGVFILLLLVKMKKWTFHIFRRGLDENYDVGEKLLCWWKNLVDEDIREVTSIAVRILRWKCYCRVDNREISS